MHGIFSHKEINRKVLAGKNASIEFVFAGVEIKKVFLFYGT